MKKICIIIPYDYPIPAVRGGAIETLVQFLVDENEKTPNYEFTVLCTYDPSAEQMGRRYQYTRFIYFKRYQYIDSVWKFVYRCIKKVLKVYVPFSVRYVSILNYIRNNRDKFDFVLFEDGLSYMLPLLARVYPKEKILNHLHCPNDGNKKTDKSFKYLLPVSRFCAEDWKHNTGRTDDTIHVWHNCFDDESFGKDVSEKEKNMLRQTHGIHKDERVIIYVGRIIPEKGVKELLLALQKVSMKNIHLLLIGKAKFGLDTETKYEKEINKIISSSQYSVSQLGFVNNSDLYLYYAISDIFVMPTLVEESAGMVNIEAMASGVPVITINKGAVKEYVDSAAITIEHDERLIERLAQAIEKLLADEKRRSEVSVCGIERASLFTKKLYFNRFIQIIHDIEKSDA